MKWYKHDTDAISDAKIKKLLIKHGAVGYAIYFHCLELIAADVDENWLTFELEHDSEIIADNLKVRGTAEKSGIEIVEDVMRYIIELGLFEESNGRITCLKLLHRLDQSMTSNTRMRKMIGDAKNNHDNIMTASCKTRIDKTRIDKTRIDGYPVTQSIHDELVSQHSLPTVLDYYERISDYVVSKGKTDYKDYARTARNWIKRDIESGRYSPPKPKHHSEPDEVEQLIMQNMRGAK